MERLLGIDLGTTNSVVAYIEQGQPVVIQNAEGSRTTPSIVLYKGPDDIIVGELAKRQAVSYPTHTIRSVKRFMGARFSESAPLTKGISYKIIEGPNDSVLIDLGWLQVTPEQVSAEILKKMKSSAEEFFGDEVTRAVITVPAYFNDNQRSATKRAGELAGLDVSRIINEPTAAALAYGIDKNLRQHVAVFDLGGGTFDITLLDIDKDLFEVRSTRGDTFLGGDTFDQALLDYTVKQFQDSTGYDILADNQALQRVKEAVEIAKCELSSTRETVISLPFLAMNESTPLHMQTTIKRETFEELIEPSFLELIDCCKKATEDAGFVDNVDSVVLVGGSTRIPAVQQLVKHHFNLDPIKSVNPDEAVAIGAAIQGAILSGSLREILLLDVTPLSLGIELSGGIFTSLIPRNSSIPTSHTRTFTTVKDNQTTVRVHVLQGERKIAAENHSLGIFSLTDITPAPKEIPAIQVTFHIDANGILHVQATDVTSGMSTAVSIENYVSATIAKAKEVAEDGENTADQDRDYIRKQFVKRQSDAIVKAADEAGNYDDFPLTPALLRQVRESAFKLDVAILNKPMDEIEREFSNLKSLSSEVEGHIAMVRHRRGGLEIGEDFL